MVGELVIGATACALLTQPRFVGGILAVVTGAVYLLSEDCEILWLAQNDLPMHPRALRGDFDFSALRAGMAFQSDGARLQFGVGAQFIAPLQNVRVWQPAAIDPSRVVSRERMRAPARASDLTGFGKPVRSLNDARALIGLGEGLTPAGDDFVGGWLFAAYHLRAAYPSTSLRVSPGAFRWDQRAVDDLLKYARSRTNVISNTLLCDHARGQSNEPMHDWLAALLQGASSREIETHARALCAVGSTTGKNLLAGAATAILSLADRRK